MFSRLHNFFSFHVWWCCARVQKVPKAAAKIVMVLHQMSKEIQLLGSVSDC